MPRLAQAPFLPLRSSRCKTAWTILFHGNFNHIRLSLATGSSESLATRSAAPTWRRPEAKVEIWNGRSQSVAVRSAAPTWRSLGTALARPCRWGCLADWSVGLNIHHCGVVTACMATGNGEQVEDLQRWGVVTADREHGALGKQEVEIWNGRSQSVAARSAVALSQQAWQRALAPSN